MNPALMNGRAQAAPKVVATLTVQMNDRGQVSVNYSGPGRDALNVMIARVQQDTIPLLLAQEKEAREKVIEVAPPGLVIGSAK